MKATYTLPVREDNRLDKFTQAMLLECVNLFSEQGYLVLKNALPVQQVQQWADTYAQSYGSLSYAELASYGYAVGDGRLLHPLPLSGMFNHPYFYAEPLIYTLMCALLGPRVVLNNSAVVVSFPGAPEQRLHRDTPFLFGANPISGQLPPYGITVGVPLVDLNSNTGGTRFYEASHRDVCAVGDMNPNKQALNIEAALGDIYLMDFRLLHGGLANHGFYKRPIVYLTYTHDWYFDVMNTVEQKVPPVVMSDADFEKVPEAYRHVLTYANIQPRQMKAQWKITDAYDSI